MSYSTFEGWKYEVDRQFRLKTQCTWSTLSGDDDVLQKAYATRISPQRFVTDYIKRHGLSTCDS